MKLTKQEVIERFCKLSSDVMTRKFECEEPADCFCGQKTSFDYRFSSEIMGYIELAVMEKIERDSSHA